MSISAVALRVRYTYRCLSYFKTRLGLRGVGVPPGLPLPRLQEGHEAGQNTGGTQGALEVRV